MADASVPAEFEEWLLRNKDVINAHLNKSLPSLSGARAIRLKRFVHLLV
jgi:hypothetical protein